MKNKFVIVKLTDIGYERLNNVVYTDLDEARKTGEYVFDYKLWKWVEEKQNEEHFQAYLNGEYSDEYPSF